MEYLSKAALINIKAISAFARDFREGCVRPQLDSSHGRGVQSVLGRAPRQARQNSRRSAGLDSRLVQRVEALAGWARAGGAADRHADGEGFANLWFLASVLASCTTPRCRALLVVEQHLANPIIDSIADQFERAVRRKS